MVAMSAIPTASTETGDAAPEGRDLWDDLFPFQPHTHPPGQPIMLRLIAYDIAAPRRLARFAAVCQDFGVRVQKSLFECWLEQDAFDRLWDRLLAEMDGEEDSLIAYTLDQSAAAKRRQAGTKAHLTDPVHLYVV